MYANIAGILINRTCGRVIVICSIATCNSIVTHLGGRGVKGGVSLLDNELHLRSHVSLRDKVVSVYSCAWNPTAQYLSIALSKRCEVIAFIHCIPFFF